jgi:hypothetical protein
VDDHAVLDGLTAAAKLQQPGPDRRIVHLRQVAGQHLVGDAHRRCHRPELHAQEFGVARANVGRLTELHVLAGLQDLHRARLQPGQRCTAGIRQAFTHQVVLGGQACVEAREHRGGFLAHELGVVVLVEFVEFDQCARQPRFTPDLSGPQGAKQVNDFAGRDTHCVETAHHATSARHRGQ